jgi:hypothetical protein
MEKQEEVQLSELQSIVFDLFTLSNRCEKNNLPSEQLILLEIANSINNLHEKTVIEEERSLQYDAIMDEINSVNIDD